jgi:large subunit ribosomal protein L18
MNTKREKKIRRKVRVRAKIRGTKALPRLSVHKTSKHIYGQFIDDSKGVTLVSFSSKLVKPEDARGKTKTEIAQLVGIALSQLAKKTKIKSAVFDRGSNRFHGRVKALAEAVRKGGVKI